MRILVTGQGGRENALVWKLAQSPQVTTIYAWPGNPGIFQYATPVEGVSSLTELKDFCLEKKIDLTIVGPEKHLESGIADLFEEYGLKVFGPTKEAAKLETSKAFAKAFMKRHGIKTASYFETDNFDSGACYIKSSASDLVVKADGLAQGKGVYVTDSKKEAIDALQELFAGAFGDAGKKAVIEERLEGPELSVFALVHEDNYFLLPFARDHKRVFEKDRGPNTGGMGAISPVLIPQELKEQIENEIVSKTVMGLVNDKIKFTGVLFIGLMLTKNGPYVLEYNVRMGDPETQAIMPLIQSDLLLAISDLLEGKPVQIELKDQYSCCVIVAAKGYPGEFQRGQAIELPTLLPDQSLIFHSGTTVEDKRLVSASGRVLSVVGVGDSLDDARVKAIGMAESIKMEYKHFRKDIGKMLD